MKFQNPTTGETVTVKCGSPAHRMYNRLGWKDITPPRSPKQIAYSRRFRQLGDLSWVKVGMLRVVRERGIAWNQADKSILMQAVQILESKRRLIQQSKPLPPSN